MKRIMLLDGDVLVYRLGFGGEKNTEWANGVHTWHANEREIIPLLDAKIRELQTILRVDKTVIALTNSEPPNFRKAIYPLYKTNRNATRKPLLYGALRAHLVDKWKAQTKPGLEADDVLGILSTMPAPDQTRIIVSNDKDFLTVPGWYYSLLKRKTIRVTEAQADYAFMLQTLTGDATDYFPGCPKIGPVKAKRALEKAGEGMFNMWAAVVQEFERANLSEADALVQARCARILRMSDYDMAAQSPILWCPPVNTIKVETDV